jgi:hypothetical protein
MLQTGAAPKRRVSLLKGMRMDDSIPKAIINLKNEFARGYKGQSVLREVLPLSHSKVLKIDDDMLESLQRFAAANPIYVRSYDLEISGIACRVYEGDINNYWLSSKKYDTSYQPFYPTWMLSAFALAHGAKSLGFEQLVDVGSGDGRIAYCGRLLGMGSHGIEIDHDLVQLQNSISAATGVSYGAIRAVGRNACKQCNRAGHVDRITETQRRLQLYGEPRHEASFKRQDWMGMGKRHCEP